MIHPKTYLKITPKGLGLFAKQRFKQGTVLWLIDDYDARMPLADYLSLNETLRQKVNIYSYLDYQHQVIIPWDEGKYVNHSCAPNLTGILEFDNISIALRTIEPDEEIVEDYYGFFGRFKSFTCACGAANCRSLISSSGAYQSDLRMDLASIRPALLSQPQELFGIRSSINEAFFQHLYV